MKMNADDEITSLLDEFEHISPKRREGRNESMGDDEGHMDSAKESDDDDEAEFEKIDHASFEDPDEDEVEETDGEDGTSSLNEDLLRRSGQLCFLHDHHLASTSTEKQALLRKRTIPFDGMLMVEIDNTRATWHNKEVTLSIEEDVFGKPLFPIATNVVQSKFATQHAMLAKGYLTQLLNSEKTYEVLEDNASFKIRVANGRTVRFAIDVKEGSIFNMLAKVNHKDVSISVYFQMDIRKALDRVRHAVSRATSSSAARVRALEIRARRAQDEIDVFKTEKSKADTLVRLKDDELRQKTIEHQQTICELGKKALLSKTRVANLQTEHETEIVRLKQEHADTLKRRVEEARKAICDDYEARLNAMRQEKESFIRRVNAETKASIDDRVREAVQEIREAEAAKQNEQAMAAAIEDIDCERKKTLEVEREAFQLRKGLERETRKVGLLEMTVAALKKKLNDASDRLEKEKENNRVACEAQRVRIATVAALTSAAKIGSIESEVSELKSEHRALELEYSKLSQRFHAVRSERNRLRNLLGITDLQTATDLHHELNSPRRFQTKR